MIPANLLSNPVQVEVQNRAAFLTSVLTPHLAVTLLAVIVLLCMVAGILGTAEPRYLVAAMKSRPKHTVNRGCQCDLCSYVARNLKSANAR